MPSDQLRTIIDRCGVSRHELCMRAGLAESILSRFMRGQSELTTRSMDKLGRVLPLTIKAGTLKKGK